MRISAKGRYALAAVVDMARQHDSGEFITVLSISERLGISKIYLEQVFALLKRGTLVHAVKGAQGGYQLTRAPGQITALQVLEAVESSLFEKAEDTVAELAGDIEAALRSAVLEPLDEAVRAVLSKISLEDLVVEAERHRDRETLMFYI